MKQPPMPKYDFDEKILFNRDDSDCGKGDEGVKVGTVSHVEMKINTYDVKCGSFTVPKGTWYTLYMVAEHNDQIPERCIGPVTLGTPR